MFPHSEPCTSVHSSPLSSPDLIYAAQRSDIASEVPDLQWVIQETDMTEWKKPQRGIWLQAFPDSTQQWNNDK